MDLKEINRIYDELDTFSIELAQDPTGLGPGYLNKVISECRNYLNRTTSSLLKIRREKQSVANALAGAEAVLKIESDEMLANDERVQKLPSIKDREAYISTALRGHVNTITSLKSDLRNLDAIESAVKIRHNELVRTDGQIKTQRALMRDEIDTKSFYGDEGNDSDFSTPEAPGKGEIDEEELDRIMAGGSERVHAGSQVDEAPALLSGTPDPLPEMPSLQEPEPKKEEALVLPVEEETPAPAELSPDEDIFASLDLNLVTLPTTPESTLSMDPVVEEALPAAVLSDDEAITRFLNDDPSPTVTDAQLLQMGDKAPTAKKKKAAPKEAPAKAPAPPSEEPDFSDILASL